MSELQIQAQVGDDSANFIIQLAGEAILEGRGGDDTLISGSGKDQLLGGEGDDRLNGGKGDDQLWGGPGDDLLWAGSGNDAVDGGPGQDTVVLDSSLRSVIAQRAANGDLSLRDLGSTVLTTLHDVEQVQFLDVVLSVRELLAAAATNGDDMLEAPATGMLVDGGLGNDTIQGQGGDDELYGGGGSDILRGGAGNDVLDGNGKYGWINGGKGVGDDDLYGQAGDDTLFGGTGHDRLFGGDGDDTFYGGAGDNLLDGGDGINWVVYHAAVQLDLRTGQATCGPNTDTLVQIANARGSYGSDTLIGDAAANVLDGQDGDDGLWGGGGNDQLIGGKGNDALHGEDGDDLLAPDRIDGVQYRAAGTDRVDGGAGLDTMVLADACADYAIGIAPNGDLWFTHLYLDRVITVLDVERVQFSDALVETASLLPTLATEGNDHLVGDAGDNRINGLGGNDRIEGGAGHDTLFGGAGNDRLIGGPGIDTLIGGAGDDSFVLDRPDDQVLVTYTEGSYGHDVVELAFTQAGLYLAPYAVGTVKVTATQPLAIDIDGGQSYNSIPMTLIGGAGPNRLIGGHGADALQGEAGDDWLDGGYGRDTLTGGAGRDSFYLGSPGSMQDIAEPVVASTEPPATPIDNADTFTDFSPAQDTVVLSAAVFTALRAWAGQRIGTETTPCLRYDSGTGALDYDIDGSGPVAGITIAFVGVATHPAELGACILIVDGA